MPLMPSPGRPNTVSTPQSASRSTSSSDAILSAKRASFRRARRPRGTQRNEQAIGTRGRARLLITKGGAGSTIIYRNTILLFPGTGRPNPPSAPVPLVVGRRVRRQGVVQLRQRSPRTVSQPLQPGQRRHAHEDPEPEPEDALHGARSSPCRQKYRITIFYSRVGPRLEREADDGTRTDESRRVA